MTANAPLVDLRSDTVTRPTPAMREAIASAEVGDATLGDDATTEALETRTAELLGTEVALFFPSGIMANQCALHVLAGRGTEALAGASSHILRYEEGAASAVSGVQLVTLPDEDGTVGPEAVADAIADRSLYRPRLSALLLENTHLESGGRIVDADTFRATADRARAAGLRVHLDGARLWHAAAGTGSELTCWTAHVDTVMVSFSKGLGAPVGSVLGAPAELHEELWRARRRFGGGMRQTGLLAAAALHALDHHRARLREDHANARVLAAAFAALPGFEAPVPETNIVLVRTPEAGPGPAEIVTFLAGHRILMIPFGGNRLRAVTHLDVDSAGIARVTSVLAGLPGALA